MGKKTCLVFDPISTAMTFTTKACLKTFKIKAKTNFWYRFNNSKSKHRAFRKSNWKVPHKLFPPHYCLDGHSGIEDWNFVIFEQCETHAQLKERETFW